MAGLLYAGFDYGTLSNLPGLWDSAFGVTILPLGSGRAGGGCARFIAANGSVLTKAPTWTSQQAYCGFAMKQQAVFGNDSVPIVTLAQLVTTASTFSLIATPAGALVLLQDGFSLCEAGPGLVQIGFASYLEWSVDLVTAAVQMRVNALAVAHGVATLAMGEAFVSFSLGGGTNETGMWDVDDVYLLDGTPQTAISVGSRVINNAGFLGNVLVQAIYPTGDGYNITHDIGYTPWTPASGTTHFNQVNENPPDGGLTNESTAVTGAYAGGHLNKYDTFACTHPSQGVDGFGVLPLGAGAWPLFAVQAIYAFQVDAAHTANATVRVVDDLPSTDDVFIGGTISPTDPAYLYFAQRFDRDPSAPFWTMDAVFLQLGLTPPRGTREFGMRRAT